MEKLIGVGVSFILLGLLLLALGALRAGKTEGGGLIVIGPFPVVFGTSDWIVKTLLAAGVALAVFFLLMNLLG